MKIAVDGHVHLHRAFRTVDAMEATLANVRRFHSSAGAAASVAVLCLTESAGDAAFDALRRRRTIEGGFEVRPTSEPESLTLVRGGSETVVLLDGRQVVTDEGLEVLSLASSFRIEDGRSAADVVERVVEGGGLAVIPWGFGKWLGARGRAVEALLERFDPTTLRLGDNGGRWRGSREPALLARARRAGFTVLPGSDPLPFADQVDRVGSRGFVVEGPYEAEAPGAWLRSRLRDPSYPIEPFGVGTSLPRFVRSQVAMQLRKRFGASA